MSSIITNDSIGINIHNIKKKIHENIKTQKIKKEQKKKKKKKKKGKKKKKRTKK
jgi:hypothetical protein